MGLKNIEFIGFKEYLSSPVNLLVFIVWILVLIYWAKVIFFGG